MANAAAPPPRSLPCKGRVAGALFFIAVLTLLGLEFQFQVPLVGQQLQQQHHHVLERGGGGRRRRRTSEENRMLPSITTPAASISSSSMTTTTTPLHDLLRSLKGSNNNNNMMQGWWKQWWWWRQNDDSNTIIGEERDDDDEENSAKSESAARDVLAVGNKNEKGGENHGESSEPKTAEIVVPGRRTALQREEIRACLRWAVGLEHESMLVHRHAGGIEEYAIDANKVLREMARYGEIHGLSKDEHALAVQAHDDGAEFSGRRCANSIDLTYKTMMESVSTDALENSFEGVHDEIQKIDRMFEKMANLHPFIQKVQHDEGLGPVMRPLTGMSSQLGMYQRTGGNWFKCASCSDCTVKDYTGSFHMSLSLPSTPDGWVARDESILTSDGTCAAAAPPPATDEIPTSKYPLARWLLSPSEEEVKSQQQQEWIEAHQNLANMIQWVEPLLIATHGSADADSVCDAGHYTEGSFRAMRTGWGVPGTTDVRTFKETGTGRYIQTNFEWMFPNNQTEGTMPSAYQDDLSGCIVDGMGADIRTKTDVAAQFLIPGENLPIMPVGRGIELRIFDNMRIEHIPQVYRMVSLVAEAGRTFTAPEYIYDNADWKLATQAVMREGWNAILPHGYVRSMAMAVNLNVPTFMQEQIGQNYQAFHVFSKVYQALWDAHRRGMWTRLLLDDSSLSDEHPRLVNPNRDSWELGAISSGYTSDTVLDTLGILTTGITVQMEDLQDHHSETGSSCGEDLEDLVYMAERFGMVSDIVVNNEGLVESFFVEDREDWDGHFFTTPVCLTDTGAISWAKNLGDVEVKSP